MNPDLPSSRIGIICLGSSTNSSLQRNLCLLAQKLDERGSTTRLFTDTAWPSDFNSCFSEVVRVQATKGIRDFADQLEALKPREKCDQLLSLERVWDCDYYWARHGLERGRQQRWQRYSHTARGTFQPAYENWEAECQELDEHLFRQGASHVIAAASELVKFEIGTYYDLPIHRIPVIYGAHNQELEDPQSARARIRKKLGIAEDTPLLVATYQAGEPGSRTVESAWRRLRKKGVALAMHGTVPTPRFGPKPITLDAAENIESLLPAADIFVHPTAYISDPVPSLAANHHHIPVVTTCTDTFGEMMTHKRIGNAIQDLDAVDALTESITEWLDPKQRKTLHRAIGNFPKRFYNRFRFVEALIHLVAPNQPNPELLTYPIDEPEGYAELDCLS